MRQWGQRSNRDANSSAFYYNTEKFAEMGCGPSIPKKYSIGGKGRKRRSIIQEVAVFVPTVRIPVDSDVVHPLRGLVSKDLVDRLSKLRAHVVALAEEICMLMITCSFIWIDFVALLTTVLIRFAELVMFFTDYADVTAVSELQQALQEYLPVVLGLTMKGFNFCLFTFL